MRKNLLRRALLLHVDASWRAPCRDPRTLVPRSTVLFKADVYDPLFSLTFNVHHLRQKCSSPMADVG